MTPSPRLALRVDVNRQELEVLEDGEILKSYPVSTSRFGLGFEEGSFKTPTGNFRIGDKIGGEAPLGTIFCGRKPFGIYEGTENDEDLVLTRILWLEGLDAGNANTHERFIYIHGTNQENLIGTPASHGCIRMRNGDVIELFNLIPVGTPMLIA